MTAINLSKAENLYLGQISWRYYNKIKKKAMEQEFSVFGLLISLSIAFFIVTGGAYSLRLAHQSLLSSQVVGNNNIYQLEIISLEKAENYVNIEILGTERLEKIRHLSLA